jgi:hypothetical protein
LRIANHFCHHPSWLSPPFHLPKTSVITDLLIYTSGNNMTLARENPPSVSLSEVSFIKETWTKANLPINAGDIISVQVSKNHIKMMELGMRSHFLRMLAIFPSI